MLYSTTVTFRNGHANLLFAYQKGYHLTHYWYTLQKEMGESNNYAIYKGKMTPFHRLSVKTLQQMLNLFLYNHAQQLI